MSKLVIFDFDGTLISLPIDWKGLKRELLDTIDSKKDHLNTSIAKILHDNRENKKLLEKKIIHREIGSLDRASPNFKMLKIYKKSVQSFKTAVYSNNYRDTILEALIRFKLPEPNIIVGRGEVERIKPDPFGVKLILKETKSKVKSTVIIGDSDLDKKVAERAGINFLSSKDLAAIKNNLFKEE